MRQMGRYRDDALDLHGGVAHLAQQQELTPPDQLDRTAEQRSELVLQVE
ncbi:hypothetical protein [Solicola gregarius]|uniref:Uncharacterized protein n=1 Tax=Solicola gregarius TaxID=2908642 RepID=A0AA46TM80_9ACTN|nr:hypothetical protein [Solicola gregarius]UYM07640.1 hypothetical protein L0C25_11385 [Solicola gregarius]